MNRSHRTGRRVIGSLIAVAFLMAAVPQSAFAEEKSFWAQWATAPTLTDRVSRPEIPIAILFTFPVMVVTTPFWLLKIGLDKMMEKSSDE